MNEKNEDMMNNFFSRCYETKAEDYSTPTMGLRIDSRKSIRQNRQPGMLLLLSLTRYL